MLLCATAQSLCAFRQVNELIGSVIVKGQTHIGVLGRHMSGAHRSDEPLIGHLYDAALGAVGWEEVLGELVRLFGAFCAAFSIVGPHRPGRIVHSGIDPALAARYLERYAGRNELALRTVKLPTGAVVTDTDVMPKDEFRRSGFYSDCLSKVGIDALMNLRAANHLDGLMANVCLFRTAAQGDFGAEHVARYRHLAPHVCRAVQLQIRTTEAEGERRALAEAMERMAHAAFVVDGFATVLRANAAGTALLAARDGLLYGPSESGTLRAAKPDETATLHRLITEAVVNQGAEVNSGSHLRISRREPHPPLVVTVLSIGSSSTTLGGLPPAAAALLLVTQPEGRSEAPSLSLLRDTFSLTRAEAEVAARAAQGEEVARIAEELGITSGTTRLHLHRIFEKTGVHRQAELALVLARLAA
jgi:DNA-binding CsgD family transcriptional regulator